MSWTAVVGTFRMSREDLVNNRDELKRMAGSAKFQRNADTCMVGARIITAFIEMQDQINADSRIID